MKDYYSVLGVSQTASDAEVKRAYRRRARELHPDVAGNSVENEEQFKELSNAYEVLGHADKRALYDRGVDPLNNTNSGFPQDMFNFGFGGDMFSDIFDVFTGGGSRQHHKPKHNNQGEDILKHVKLSLEESLTGVTKQLSLDVAVRCAKCGGSGSNSGNSETICRTCQGQGVVQHVTRSLLGQIVQQTICPDCEGAGKKLEDPCSDCSGRGIQLERKNISVDIPLGVRNGNKLRFENMGHAGLNGGIYGNLYVEIGIKSHEVFDISGNDLTCKLSVQVTTALLGGQVKVDVFGKAVSLEIPVGVTSGFIVSLPNLGLPHSVNDTERRGDLKIFLEVLLPAKLSEKERQLILELRHSLKDDKQKFRLQNLRDGGFFSWLKKFF